MFRHITVPANEQRRAVNITVAGRPVQARQGETLAAALLSSGVMSFRRTPVSGEPRSPLCLMGICFDCVIEVDGTSVQSCMVEVREGMKICLPDGARRVGEPE